MFLLYLDESGNENEPADRHFVLAGIALFERQTYFLSKAIDGLQERHFPKHQPIDFHASAIRAGRGFWRNVSEEKRSQILDDLAAEICRSPDRGRVLYAAAIEKTDLLYGEAAVEKATEEVCRRFDIHLTRRFQDHDDPQRGLIIFSEGRLDARAKIWVRDFHKLGTRWGAINNLADIPYFASMRESRLLQLADYVAHATWLLYEKRDSRLIHSLIDCFDNRGGVLHGLVHVRGDSKGLCECPACASRRRPGDFGNWTT